VYTGLRKGEKLYEELLIGNDALATKNAKIFKANETFLDLKILEKLLIELEEAEEKFDIKRLKEIFSKSVSGFTSKISS
jgi:UDP-N-acetylglucosamine 4,6-dehydratase